MVDASSSSSPSTSTSDLLLPPARPSDAQATYEETRERKQKPSNANNHDDMHILVRFVFICSTLSSFVVLALCGDDVRCKGGTTSRGAGRVCRKKGCR